MVKIIKNDKGKRENDCVQNQPGLPLATTVNLAVVGDSHVGFLNSQSMFNTLLQRVVNNSNKRYIIFGGDDVHALGASSIQVAETYYQQFTNILNNVLGSIPFRSSIGNWEATNRNNSRALFRQYINRYLTGYRVIPGTQGLVRHVWLDNGRGGVFSQDSLNLLSNLDPNYYYIIDFHWPLRVPGITTEIHGDHVMTQMQTNMFFNAIPSNVRNKILAIFTHHAHKFFANSVTINPNFPNTSFFVTGCSGDYACISSERGYYELNLTVQNNIATLQTIKTRVQ